MKRVCSVCKETHLTGLHGYVRQSYNRRPHSYQKKDVEQKDLTNGCVATGGLLSSSISLCVVPVRLCHHERPNISIETFALLDNGSQGTFVRADVLNQLNVTGIKTSLSLKTIHGEQREDCFVVEGLQVKSLQSGRSESVPLPRTFTKSMLPVESEDVPTADKLNSKWSYLDSILHLLPTSTTDIKVGLLIGANCPKSLEPLEVIASQDNGPFAYRSRLGWCVSGPMEDTSTQTVSNLGIC